MNYKAMNTYEGNKVTLLSEINQPEKATDYKTATI